MKLSTLKSLSHSFLVLFILFSAQTAFADTGKAFSIKGKVTVNGEPMTLATTLKAGDVIKTAKDSSVKVVMKDGTAIDILENTEFKISKYSFKQDAPEESSSAFNLIGGAFRYVSGLIAKKDPSKVKLTAGTATIGIRGTFVDVSSPTSAGISGAGDGGGNTLAVRTSIGAATVTFPDGTSMNVASGQIGTRNLSTGVTATNTSPPDAVAAAAIAMAADPANAAAALSTMSAADAALAMATLVNNAASLGADTTALTQALSSVVTANPSLATGLAYVTSAVSSDPTVSAALTTAIKTAAPDQADAVDAASSSGDALEQAPPPSTSEFNLRVATDGSVEVLDEDGEVIGTIENTNPSGSPLTTEQIQEALEIINSGS